MKGRVPSGTPLPTDQAFLPVASYGVGQLSVVRTLGCRCHSARPAHRECFIYSDLGADVSWLDHRSHRGVPLDEFVQHAYRPVGMSDTFFRPADSTRLSHCADEIAPPRGYPLRGEVHDENAFVLGGVADRRAVLYSCRSFGVRANDAQWWPVRWCAHHQRLHCRVFTRRAGGINAGGSRALGWDTADGDGSSGVYLPRPPTVTRALPARRWIVPERQMFVVLLTNRVHAARAKRPGRVIADVRADLSDAAAFAGTDVEFAIDDKVRLPR